jgi:hypothetical protein
MSSVFVHKPIWLTPAEYRTKHLLQNLAMKKFTSVIKKIKMLTKV